MICERCSNKIKKTNKAVLWKTFIDKEILEEVYWHYNCFIEWRDESLENRAKKLYNESMKNVLPKFQNMLKGIGNSKEIVSIN
ncbi:MAG TPA: hypothetical protein VMZ91_14700 [Candidatus Paceibacterota bacterium]|nr:hypothetical protein [Candidatus Paceibacterota bacterium]